MAWNSTAVVGTGTIRTDSVRWASQRARSTSDGRIPRKPQLHAVAGALAEQHLPVHQQRRVVDARRGTTGYPFGQPHREEAGQRRGREGVDDQQPTGPQQPAHLGEGRRQVRDVFEDLTGRHHVRTTVDQRNRRDVGPHRHDAVPAPLGRARWPMTSTPTWR